MAHQSLRKLGHRTRGDHLAVELGRRARDPPHDDRKRGRRVVFCRVRLLPPSGLAHYVAYIYIPFKAQRCHLPRRRQPTQFMPHLRGPRDPRWAL